MTMINSNISSSNSSGSSNNGSSADVGLSALPVQPQPEPAPQTPPGQQLEPQAEPHPEPHLPAQPATLDHAGIAARIPHHGSMCLLHSLLGWGADHISCSATSHADVANPLRSDTGLSSANAIEYAAQAMALHGGLCAAPGSAPTPGFLASVRNVRLLVPRLDDIQTALTVSARRLAGDTHQAMYGFALHDAHGTLLVDGRATVILNALP